MGPIRTAIHEAGHAVVAAHHGWCGVRIELTGGTDRGRFYFRPPRLAGLAEPWRSAEAIACCRVAVAGAVAGTRATRRRGWER